MVGDNSANDDSLHNREVNRNLERSTTRMASLAFDAIASAEAIAEAKES